MGIIATSAPLNQVRFRHVMRREKLQSPIVTGKLEGKKKKARLKGRYLGGLTKWHRKEKETELDKPR